MKKFLLALIATGFALSGWAQADTTAPKADTIRVGGMVIIKTKDGSGDNNSIRISNRRNYKPSKISTNWWIFDFGFANIVDNTNYASPEAQAIAPGMDEDKFDLTGKSVNVNIWVFMQRLSLIKNAVNLKYGLGVELNNYHFDDRRVRFQKNPTQIFMDQELASVKKNKLAADYVTVPMMLNFNFTPNRRRGFGISAGMSAGYLYSARQKLKDDGKKTKLKDDFDLHRWKISYIGEVNLGPVKLYGSYATRSMFRKGLDHTPYNVGIRFGSW